MNEELRGIIQPHLEEVISEEERRVTVKAKRDEYKDLLEALRNQGTRHLTSITGTDLGEEFELIYHLNWKEGTLLNVKITVPKDEGTVETVTDLFPGAILYERENMEMLGLEVEDHPDPRRLFLAEDWPENGHPLREGRFNYRKILEKNIPEIKELSKELDFDYKKMLEVEKKKKDRKSLKKWLDRKIGSEE